MPPKSPPSDCGLARALSTAWLSDDYLGSDVECTDPDFVDAPSVDVVGPKQEQLLSALRIGRQGEIRDRTSEGQHYRMAGLNLLAAIIIYWSTAKLGDAVEAREKTGMPCPPELLSQISPLGWAHILLTGEYRWRKR